MEKISPDFRSMIALMGGSIYERIHFELKLLTCTTCVTIAELNKETLLFIL